jgi:hypothetical protein
MQRRAAGRYSCPAGQAVVMSMKVALIAAGLFALAMTAVGPGEAGPEPAATIGR